MAEGTYLGKWTRKDPEVPRQPGISVDEEEEDRWGERGKEEVEGERKKGRQTRLLDVLVIYRFFPRTFGFYFGRDVFVLIYLN